MADDIFSHYERALDEIYYLRGLMAAEARVTEAHLELKSFPKSRRRFAEEAVERQRRCAKGEAEQVYAEFGLTHNRAKSELRRIGAKGTLTRGEWEAGAR